MEPWYVALFRKLPLDRKTVSTLLPVVGRYGARGAVVMARSYLGPVACDVERRVRNGLDPCGQPQEKTEEPQPSPGVIAAATGERPIEHEPREVDGTERPVDATAESKATSAGSANLSDVDVAILGMAVTKLIYEAGELALHNPTVSADGKQPEFKLDDNGHAPPLSLAHVVAATRVYRTYTAERAERKQAEEAEAHAAAEAEARARSAPRLRLQAARGQLYAGAPRYSYVPTLSTNRRS